MTLVHSKKNCGKLIDQAKYDRVIKMNQSLIVGVERTGDDWWDFTITSTLSGNEWAIYNDGFIYMWFEDTNTHMRVKVHPRDTGLYKDCIRVDGWYCVTIGDVDKVKYKEQDKLMRGMLNVV